MIKLDEHRTALINLGTTIEALETIDQLIAFYSQDSKGPAYVLFQAPRGDGNVQFSRDVAVQALKAQREIKVQYLATLGIEA